MRRIGARIVDVDLKQNAVARGLVDLNIETVSEQPFELSAVETGFPAQDRQARRVERELIFVPGLDHIAPARMGRSVILQLRLAELGRDHLLGSCYPEIFRNQ